jgi:hypothetical protein
MLARSDVRRVILCSPAERSARAAVGVGLLSGRDTELAVIVGLGVVSLQAAQLLAQHVTAYARRQKVSVLACTRHAHCLAHRTFTGIAERGFIVVVAWVRESRYIV